MTVKVMMKEETYITVYVRGTSAEKVYYHNIRCDLIHLPSSYLPGICDPVHNKAMATMAMALRNVIFLESVESQELN
jgi:hypothetical protein